MTTLMTHLKKVSHDLQMMLRNQDIFCYISAILIAWLEALGTSKQHAFIMPSCVTHDRWWCRLKIKMHAMKTVMQQKLPSVIYVFVQFGNWFFIGLDIWITQRSLGYIVICFICLMGKLKPAMKPRSYFTPKIIEIIFCIKIMKPIFMSVCN